jgi:hypothetical protein
MANPEILRLSGKTAKDPMVIPVIMPNTFIHPYLLFFKMLIENLLMKIFFFENPFHLQSVYIHSANWCEVRVLWLGEGHSLLPFRSY